MRAQIEPVTSVSTPKIVPEVDGRVALEVVALLARPEQAQRLPRAPAEAGVRGQRDRDVDEEDPLARRPVRVLGRPERTRAPRRRRAAGRRRARAQIPRLFDNDVLKGGPGEYREKRRRTGRESRGTGPGRRPRSRRRRRRRSAARAAGRGAAAAARAREPATAIAASSVPTAQMPTSASATAATVAQSDRLEEERERGQRDRLDEDEERERRERASRARSRCGRTARARARRARPAPAPATNARPRPSSAVKTIASQSRPCGGVRVCSPDSAKRKATSIATTKSDHRGQRVAPAQLEQEVLARERGGVAEVAGHANATRPVASDAEPLGVVRGDEERPLVPAARRARGRAAPPRPRRAR